MEPAVDRLPLIPSPSEPLAATMSHDHTVGTAGTVEAGASSSASRRAPEAHRRLEDQCRRLRETAGTRGALAAPDQVPLCHPKVLLEHFRGLHAVLQEAMAGCRFADQALVRDRADHLATLAADLGTRGRSPDCAEPRTPVQWLAEWRQEMSELLDLARAEGAPDLPEPPALRPALWDEDAEFPRNFVALFRLRRVTLSALEDTRPERERHKPGNQTLLGACQLLRDCEERDLRQPDSRSKLDAALTGAGVLTRLALRESLWSGEAPSTAIAHLRRLRAQHVSTDAHHPPDALRAAQRP